MRKSGENNLTNEKVSKERMEYEEQAKKNTDEKKEPGLVQKIINNSHYLTCERWASAHKRTQLSKKI